MNRYTAPLGFTLLAIWVVVIFTIVAGQPAHNSQRATHTTQSQTTQTQTTQSNTADH